MSKLLTKVFVSLLLYFVLNMQSIFLACLEAIYIIIQVEI